MAKPESLSNRQLAKLLLKVIESEEEWDEVSPDIVLELQGVTRQELADDVRQSLVQEVEKRRSRGENVPQPLLDVVTTLRKSSSNQT